MSSVVISGDTSGAITVSAPAVAGTNTLTLQAATATSAVNTLGTAVASTSGTSIDFTSIPSWVKRITVLLSGVSTNGTSNILCRIGDSSGIVSSGYVANSTNLTNAAAVGISDATTALPISILTSAANITVGKAVWEKVDGNTWLGSSQCRTSTTVTTLGSATVTLSNTLTQVRITTVNGTDTFDAGTINILYEG